MKVTSLEIENFCKITALNIKLNDHVTELSGDNGAGKSSTLNGLWVLLKGKRVAPEEPIRKGTDRSRLRGRLGEYLVTRTFTRDKHGEITTSLRIERGDEGMPATEGFLRELIGEHMLDPGDFIKLTPAEKFDVFRSFVPGVDFRLIANQNRKDYDRRTDVNRIAREQRGAANSIQVPEDAPTEPVNVDELLDELRRTADGNVDVERRRSNREKAVADIERLRTFHADHGTRFEAFAKERMDRCNAEVDELLAQMEALKRRIEATKAKADLDIGAKSAAIAVEATNALTEAEELQAKLDAAGPLSEPANLEALQQRISEARATNDLVAKARERARHLQTAEQYERESEEITARMKDRERSKQEAIAKAGLPIAGITFGDDEILLNGVPFEQASTAVKLKCGVAIAVAKNPTLRLVWIRDASLLDDKSYKQVEQLAKEFDAQILLETVRPIGQDAIVLEDGRLKQKAAKATAAASA
jgi:hypothetical protein